MRNQPPGDTFAARPRPLLIKLLAAAAVLIFSIGGAIRLYIEQLWFESVGYESVYWYGIEAQSIVFAAVFVLTTAVLWGIFRLIIAVAGEVRRPFLQVQGRPIPTPPLRTVQRLARSIALILGFVIAMAFSTRWEIWSLYLNQPAPGSVVDPIFGRSVEWFFLTLPILESIAGWFTIIAVVAALAAIAYLVLGMTVQFRGISIAASLVMASFALRTLLSRYSLLLQDHNLFSGVSYVDDNVLLVSMLATAIALLAGAVAAALNTSGRLRTLAVAVAIPVVANIVGGGILPWYVRTFVVRPNELVRESPYIRRNVEFTRKAFGLDRVEKLPFEPRESGVGFDPNAHRLTLDNMRLWDWKALQDTLRQIQVIRPYYDFHDIDIDRYVVGGKTVGTMVATREIDLNRLRPDSRNWVNDRLVYTHGYGIAMNGASRFTRDGLPQFILSDMPARSTAPEIQIKRPEIYFGELTNWPVYVKTGQPEFNYPEGDANNYSTHEGTGGVRVGSFFRRLLLAYEVGDLLTLPFSNDVMEDSALLLHRNIITRASRLAPFLMFDDDPYMVVGEDGALYWMIDAYTSSARYPYSRHLVINRREINYIRNSVKVVIDAYNGDVTFYIFDPEDPLINAYARMFPDLFRPRADMPGFLVKHVRYPELFFQVQAAMYSFYHVENEQVFYSREDVWTVAQQGRGQTGVQAAEIEPFFVLMTFPGESNLEFVSILPFTPATRNNLIGWLAARSDGDNYGRLRAYHLPKTRFVDGPLQIQARIDQDPQLSSQLSLWNQQGSSVIRGNLLVIPIEDTLLFVEPIYLQAQRSAMPALRLIVLATQDRLTYATTFEEALKLLVEGRPGALTQVPSQPQTTPVSAVAPTAAPGPSATPAQRANQALADYQRLTAAGRHGEAGAKLDELKVLLEQMNR
jgi:uncharacterized membrane protein (UPF0182 family)